MKKLLFIIITFCLCQVACAQTDYLSLADSCAKIGEFDKAIEYTDKVLTFCKQNYGEESKEYANVLLWKSEFINGKGQTNVAIDLTLRASLIFVKTIGKKSEEYATSLNDLARYNYDLGNYQEAIRFGTGVMEIMKGIFGAKHSAYATSLNNLALYNDGFGNHQEAVRLGSEALKIRKVILGAEHPGYATSLNNLASYNRNLGNYQEAIRLGTEALVIYKEVLGAKHPYYSTSLSNLASYNNSLGNYQEAVKLGTEAMEIRKEVLGEKHPSHALSLSNLASYNSDLGNYQEAIRLGTMAMEIRKEVLGEKHPDYASSLNNLAAYNGALGNYQEAIRLGTMALDIQKEVLGEKHPDYALSLNNLAGYNSDLGNYQEAIRLGTMAMEIRKEVLGEKHPDYAKSLHNLASYNSRLGNYQEAIRLATKAMGIYKEVLGEKHPNYAQSLNNLAGYNSELGNYQEAIRSSTEAMEIRKEILGEKHPHYASSLNNLAYYFYNNGNKQEFGKYARETFNLGKELIVGNFATMTPSEMGNFLSSQKTLIDERPNATVAYDALLLSKGVLLNAEMGINELIQESGDKAAIEMLEHIRMNTLVQNKQLEKPIAERYLNTDSLSAEIEKERKQLAVQSKAFGDFTRFFNTSWQDVRDNLKANEAAIEFGTLPKDKYRPSSHCTRALILKHDSQEPIDIYLELDSTKNFQTNILANWPTIQQQLQGISKVYFSPSAELYSTPIENYISDGREYIRVSSTREVVMNNSTGNSADKPMKLYGGLKYDMTIDALTGANKEYKLEESDQQDLYAYAKRSSRDAITQVVFDELKGTLKEVQAIEGIAKSNKRKCEVLTGEQGTEESLRAINGKRYGILHFSTHGFYWTEEEAEDRALDNRLSFLRMGDDQPRRYEEDKSMTRSGLIFSGANLAMGGAELPEGMEDGIATAQEISHLDLRGCDLVVLSACQTGLGEVSGEGVFGLQRGFKKAGVNSILMSLWEVDDRATQMLMVEFYKHYLAGESKLESLRKAQNYVKSQPGFESPEYWAAFILLDGMN